jgi:hypothetical protein
MYYNGQRCTPKFESRNDRYEPGYRKHHRRDRDGVSVDLRPNMRLQFGQGLRIF